MGNDKPPSRPPQARSSIFLLGRDSRGNWIAQDQQHVCGGLFVSRAQALKFALFENGNRPHAVINVPGVLELDIGGNAASRTPASIPGGESENLRRVA